MHARDLAKGTLNQIIGASGVDRDEFLKALKKFGLVPLAVPNASSDDHGRSVTADAGTLQAGLPTFEGCPV